MYSKIFKSLSLLGKRRFSQNYPLILEDETVKRFFKLISSHNNPFSAEKPTFQRLLDHRFNLEQELNNLMEIKEKDKEMLELIEEEKRQYYDSIREVNINILNELVPPPEYHRDVVLEVTAGIGGKEAMLFARELFEMYSRYSIFKRWTWDVQDFDVSVEGGMRHGSAFVSGRDASIRLGQESGVHRVQRVPATEKAGRVHTSTVTVAVLPQPTDIEVVIKDNDIKMETKTSSGAGGQHVNKTESCVRITHIPTGIVIENQTDRSQIQNRKIALQRLRSKLYEIQVQAFQSETISSRKEQVGSSMRSDKIRTYNFNQDRISDHRIGVTLHDLTRFFQGGPELDSLIDVCLEKNWEEQLLRIIKERLR